MKIGRRRNRLFAIPAAFVVASAHGWLAPATRVSSQHHWHASSTRWRHKVQHRLHSLPPGVTDPQENLPSGWEVWDEGGEYTYYNVVEDPYYERPTTVHPFYGDVRSAEAIAADAALEALVAGVEAPFLPLDGPDEGEGVTPSLGGRVDGALPASRGPFAIAAATACRRDVPPRRRGLQRRQDLLGPVREHRDRRDARDGDGRGQVLGYL